MGASSKVLRCMVGPLVQKMGVWENVDIFGCICAAFVSSWGRMGAVSRRSFATESRQTRKDHTDRLMVPSRDGWRRG